MPKKLVDNFLYEDLTYKIRGAIFKVYNNLGFGHKETVYQKALGKELTKLGIKFIQESVLDVIYEGEKIGVYKPDFTVEDKIILEVKSLPVLPKTMETQLTNYLKGTGYKLGLLVNFGSSNLDIRRRVWDSEYQRKSARNRR